MVLMSACRDSGCGVEGVAVKSAGEGGGVAMFLVPSVRVGVVDGRACAGEVGGRACSMLTMSKTARQIGFAWG